jgi:hypothetical protein
MISHDYMTTSPYGPVVFTTRTIKNSIIVNVICNYVLHDCKTSSMAKI